MRNDIMEQSRAAFRAEALDLLAALDEGLLAVEADPGNAECVHRVFRAIHTVKGTGATMGFAHLAGFAHKVEEAFDLARSGKLAITPELVDCGLRACDVLRSILNGPDPEHEDPGEKAVRDALAKLLPSASEPAGQTAVVASNAAAGGMSAYEVILRPHTEYFHSGSDPVTLLDEVRGLGQAHVNARAEAVPLLSELDPESCYLGWEVRLVTSCPESRIRDVFSFVEDECDVSIRLIEDQTSAVAFLGAIPADMLETFLAECREHLGDVENDAGSLKDGKWSREALDGVFRAVHSIKGAAGLVTGQLPVSSLPPDHSLPLLARVAHELESVLDRYRSSGVTTVPAETVKLVLDTHDAMHELLENLAGQTRKPVLPSALLSRLGLEGIGTEEGVTSPATSAFANTLSQCLEIFENCLRQIEAGQGGNAALKTYLRGLKTLGSGAAYYKCADFKEPIAAQTRIVQAGIQAGRMLSNEECAMLRHSLEVLRSSQCDPQTAVPAEVNRDAGQASETTRPASGSQAATVRIDQEKLDRLMRVVGELIVARAAFPVLQEKLAAGEDRALVARALKEAGRGISHIAEELQASVMAIRMMPVKTVFQRFPRMVRDLARGLGKEVQLVVEGESTELDKSILDCIGDPLVHLVRNAVDHGLETAAVRERNGKPAAGRIVLRAGNVGSNVVIEVEDDGRGLDTEKLKRKAIEKGLLSQAEAQSMSHAQACRLVFLPGLSTKEKVTDVSGRGVGMDVVSNNVRNLHGSIDIRSTEGKGSVFTIQLPTSLIISKGILLEAGGEEYILPLESIRDMVKIPEGNIHQYRDSRMTQSRGDVYALYSLAELLGLAAKPSSEVPVAVVDTGKVRYGLIADRFVSEVEVLVKPLSGGLAERREFHGAAILGDGRVVLVLNPIECCRLEAMASE